MTDLTQKKKTHTKNDLLKAHRQLGSSGSVWMRKVKPIHWKLAMELLIC